MSGSGKTQFVHGTPVTPEFMNAINNPVYSDSPSADGEIPYPSMDLRRLSDIDSITGVELEGFLTGLGYGQPQGSPAPLSGAQIKALVEAIDSNPALRVALVQSLISNLRYPGQKLPIALDLLFSGASISAMTFTSPYLGATYVIDTPPRLAIPDSPGYLPASVFLGNPKLTSASLSINTTWANPQVLAAAAILSSPFPIVAVSKSLESLLIRVRGDSAAAGSRSIRIGIQVNETADCDYTFPLYFDASDSDFSAAQFSEISFYAFDGLSTNISARFTPDVSDIWSGGSGKANWQVRVVRAAGVVKVGMGVRP